MTRLLQLLAVFALPLSVCAQALPGLPDLPSPSPRPTPSPLPSALNDIVNPSPSPITPTAIPPNSTPSAPTKPGQTPTSPPPSPQPSQSPIPSPSPSVSPSPGAEFTNSKGVCQRDETKPRPILGKSQRRYALSVLLSAAAVGLASLFYGLASDWEPQEDHALYRLIWIIFARVLIVGSVKVSAALVASITKASPDDGALDASGAFLTWGSAIFTRLYYEGFKMTMAALEFTENDAVWDDKLKDFLSVRRVHEDSEGLEDRPFNGIEAGGGDEGHSAERGVTEYITGKLTLGQRIMGGNIERKLLLVTAAMYLASEISVLTANVLVLLGAFVSDADSLIFFSSDDLGGQCGIRSSDAPELLFFPMHVVTVLIGAIALQITYALTQQPSLVPILTVSAFCPKCRYEAINKVLKKLRWLSCVVLGLWVGSLLTLPLLTDPLQPFFASGDISLFWYVVIAPPSYKSVSYIITAAFTVFAAIVGTFIIYRIEKSQRKSKQFNDKL